MEGKERWPIGFQNWCSVAQVAGMLSCSELDVRWLLKTSQLKGHKWREQWFIPTAEVRLYLKNLAERSE